MKKLFALCLILALSHVAYAHDVYNVLIDGIHYRLYTRGKTAKIVPNYPKKYSYSGDIVIPETVEYEGKKYVVKIIGARAFYGCDSLTSVIIGNRVTIIEDEAFFGCRGLTSIAIPKRVRSIGHGVFSDSPGLTNIIVSPQNRRYDSRNNCNAIIEKRTNKLIYGCNSTLIPQSVTCIGDSAFYGCLSGAVTIPIHVMSIGRDAFAYCNLTDIHCEWVFPPSDDVNFPFSSPYYPQAILHIPKGTRDKYNAVEPWKDFEYKKSEGESGLTYNLTEDGKAVEVIAGSKEACCGSIIIPDSVEHEGRMLEVKSIGDNAFYECGGLESITIPNSVTNIGEGAFYGCYRLNSIAIPNGVTAIKERTFYDCHALESITIPNSVTTIETKSFYNCYYLSSVVIPNGVTTIEDDAFFNCYHLSSVTIPSSVTKMGVFAFSENTGISVCSKKDGNCLNEVHISDIAAWCKIGFYSKKRHYHRARYPLFDIHNLYLNGEEIKDLIIPNDVMRIRDRAFYNCSSITSVIIPNSITSIGDESFYGCSGITSVTIPNSVTLIGDRAFYNCSNISHVEIGRGVKSIGDNAFYYCSNLTSVAIPNSVWYIGGGAFAGCSGLKSIVIGDSVEVIDHWAFDGCSSLTTITIPKNVNTIGYHAFDKCPDLKEIHCEGYNPPVCYDPHDWIWSNYGRSAYGVKDIPAPFSNEVYTTATLFIPKGARKRYKSAEPWNKFKKIVEE